MDKAGLRVCRILASGHLNDGRLLNMLQIRYKFNMLRAMLNRIGLSGIVSVPTSVKITCMGERHNVLFCLRWTLDKSAKNGVLNGLTIE